MTSETILAKLEEHKVRIKKYGVKKIGYSLISKKRTKTTSDIDIL